jgi:hypothetical protein
VQSYSRSNRLLETANLPSQTDHSDSSSSDQPRTLPALEVNPLVNPLLAENMGRWAEVYFKSPPENREQAVRELLQQLEAENAQREKSEATPRWTNEQGFTQDESSRSEAFVPSLENRPPQAGDSFTERFFAEHAVTEPSVGHSSPDYSLGEHPLAGHPFAEEHFTGRPLTERSFTEPSLEDRLDRSRSAENRLAKIACRSCGYDNRADQRFCGMCGLPLQREIAAEPASEEEEIDARIDQEFRFRRPEEFEHELPNSWNGRTNNADDSFSDGLIHSLGYGASARSYRGYIAAVVVVVVLAVGYVAWRSARGAGVSSAPIQAPPAASTQSAQPTSASIPAQAESVEQSGNDKGTDTGVVASASEAVGKPNIERPSAERPGVEKVSTASNPTRQAPTSGSGGNSRSISPSPATTAESPTFGPGGSGYEELAVAKRYLNGSAGQQNSTEAVDWLWKSVAKRNTDATLLLSDMFMRGSGIPKNCDQARVLLQAAASRGVKDAALRLRNMQAFGCQ